MRSCVAQGGRAMLRIQAVRRNAIGNANDIQECKYPLAMQIPRGATKRQEIPQNLCTFYATILCFDQLTDLVWFIFR